MCLAQGHNTLTPVKRWYNQIPHPTQDINGKVTNSQLNTTNESQEVSPSPGDHKAQLTDPQKGITNTRQKKHKRSTKEVPPWNGQYNILLEGLNRFKGANLTLNSDVDQDTYMFGFHKRPLTYQCISSKNI